MPLERCCWRPFVGIVVLGLDDRHRDQQLLLGGRTDCTEGDAALHGVPQGFPEHTHQVGRQLLADRQLQPGSLAECIPQRIERGHVGTARRRCARRRACGSSAHFLCRTCVRPGRGRTASHRRRLVGALQLRRVVLGARTDRDGTGGAGVKECQRVLRVRAARRVLATEKLVERRRRLRRSGWRLRACQTTSTRSPT